MAVTHLNRRHFIGALLASAALPLSSLQAADAEALKVDDPAAQSLGYVEKASAAKDPAFKSGSKCANCGLYGAAQEKGGRAPCGAFGGKTVAATGWCKVWNPRA